jgi:hypothetical protein
MQRKEEISFSNISTKNQQHSDMPFHKICYRAIKEARSECTGQAKIQLAMMVTTTLEEAIMVTMQGIEETMEDLEWKGTSLIVPYFPAHFLAHTRYLMPQRAIVSISKRIPNQSGKTKPRSIRCVPIA